LTPLLPPETFLFATEGARGPGGTWGGPVGAPGSPWGHVGPLLGPYRPLLGPFCSREALSGSVRGPLFCAGAQKLSFSFTETSLFVFLDPFRSSLFVTVGPSLGSQGPLLPTGVPPSSRQGPLIPTGVPPSSPQGPLFHRGPFFPQGPLLPTGAPPFPYLGGPSPAL